MLDRIRIVLSHTTHPGNIGATARAMKTMGLSRLVLVNPKDYPSAEATARASGADDLLAAATVAQDLEQALAGCRLVLGSSARLRKVPLEQLDAREAARRAVDEAPGGEVAVLFGRERSGLSNEEIDRCHALLHVPTNPDYSSLNLASAVQVISYELRMALVEAGGVEVPRMTEHEPASQDLMEGFFEHLGEALTEIKFLHPTQSVTMMSRLRRLFLRARPSENELHILRGILSAAQKSARGNRSR